MAGDPTPRDHLPRRPPTGARRGSAGGDARRRLQPPVVPIRDLAGDRAGRRRRVPRPGHPLAPGLRGPVRALVGCPAEGLHAGRTRHLQHGDRGHQPRLWVGDDDGRRAVHRAVPGRPLPRDRATTAATRRPGRPRRPTRRPGRSDGIDRLVPAASRAIAPVRQDRPTTAMGNAVENPRPPAPRLRRGRPVRRRGRDSSSCGSPVRSSGSPSRARSRSRRSP